ncbi:MAG: 5'-nucleotidase C-terminal domain-containing protein, partial [Saprospiraceae bacterium]
LLHASDFEGATDATIDAPNFAAVVDAFDNAYPNTVILASGDCYIPGPFLFASEDPSLQNPLRTAVGTYFTASGQVRAAIGRADIAILNMIGIEASALGNHEFDLGTTEVNSMIGVDIRSGGADRRWVGAQFPYLSSNLSFASEPALSYLVTTDGREATDFRTPPAIANNSEKKGLARSSVITRNGEKIGLVGATTPRLAQISSPGNTQVLNPGAGTDNMADLASIIQPVVDALRAQGINKIILMTHLQQLAFEKQLAPLVKGVDIIIAGGSHALCADANDRLRVGDAIEDQYPIQTLNADGEPCLIVNTKSEYKYLGRLVVDFDQNGVLVPASLDDNINGAYATDTLGVTDVWAGNYAAAFTPASKGQNVRDLCNAIRNVIVAKDGNILGKTNVFLEGRRAFVRTQETNFGNLSADANLWLAKQVDPKVAISFKNGGGIRQAIGQVLAVGSDVQLLPPGANPLAGKEEGDISQLDLENSLRFNNRLSVLELTADGVAQIIEHGVRATAPGATPGQFPQVGGVRFSFDPTLPAGDRVRSAIIVDENDNTLDTIVKDGNVFGNPARKIKVVTLNFLAGGGDSYPFPTLGTKRVDLDTVITTPGLATFTVPGSEQDALAEYLLTFHPDAAKAYDTDDTPVEEDSRIQQLNRRGEGIFPIGNFGLLSPPDNFRLVTSPTNATPVPITWERADNASNYQWLADFPGGNFGTPLLSFPSNNGGTAEVLTNTVQAIDGILGGFGLPAGDSTNIIWTVRAYAFNRRDSLGADDVFTLKLVRDAQIQPFNLLTPANGSTLTVGGNPNTAFPITWQTTTSLANGPIRYSWQAGLDSATAVNAPLLAFPSDNGGASPVITFTAGQLDQILQSAGLPVGGSVTVSWVAKAQVGQFSRFSNQAFRVTLVRTGIIGTYEPAEGNLNLYPNPTSGLLTIELTEASAGEYEIFSNEGRLVQRGQLSSNKETIEVKSLQNGVYNLTVRTEKGQYATRFTLQK